ncbi:uncharacterized protein TNIN_437551 [Trichonephila inaurata madagascariensis]|uniref:Uncharacterized protein n=1 Tax=Trichonephila inaurata madagascariensis TaxID=2747483 RepID=A0A8X7CNC5_9ARAC|nr:uncharacterized protein TNIN_437551 [Trichonephila inaurata madagascariensis]
MWVCGVDWDTYLGTENIKRKFLKWYNGLEVLNELRIPWRMGIGDKSFWLLHVFCDASQHAYATAYTFPALTLDGILKYFWTDSTTAISWIQSNDVWGTFVGNRVKEVSAFSRADQWSYVPGLFNPADLPSRGCFPLQFSKSDWWSGPDWLKDPRDRWPRLEIKPDEIFLLECRKGINLNVGLGVTAGIVEVKWVLAVLKNDSDFGLGKKIHKKLPKESRKSRAPFLSAEEVQGYTSFTHSGREFL